MAGSVLVVEGEVVGRRRPRLRPTQGLRDYHQLLLSVQPLQQPIQPPSQQSALLRYALPAQGSRRDGEFDQIGPCLLTRHRMCVRSQLLPPLIVKLGYADQVDSDTFCNCSLRFSIVNLNAELSAQSYFDAILVGDSINVASKRRSARDARELSARLVPAAGRLAALHEETESSEPSAMPNACRNIQPIHDDAYEFTSTITPRLPYAFPDLQSTTLTDPDERWGYVKAPGVVAQLVTYPVALIGISLPSCGLPYAWK